MPYRPTQARQETATTAIEYDGETVNVTYRKKLVQTATFNVSAEEPRYLAPILREELERLIVSWDVLDEDDQPLPATQDVTRSFEFEFLLAVFEGVMEHALPGEHGGATSSTGSSTAATSGRARKSTR